MILNTLAHSIQHVNTYAVGLMFLIYLPTVETFPFILTDKAIQKVSQKCHIVWVGQGYRLDFNILSRHIK